MSRYLNTLGESCFAIAICMRCGFKVRQSDLRIDPNNQQPYCKDCIDMLDPYRKPPRAPDQITVKYPRPDTPLNPGEEE